MAIALGNKLDTSGQNIENLDKYKYHLALYLIHNAMKRTVSKYVTSKPENFYLLNLILLGGGGGRNATKSSLNLGSRSTLAVPLVEIPFILAPQFTLTIVYHYICTNHS